MVVKNMMRMGSCLLLFGLLMSWPSSASSDTGMDNVCYGPYETNQLGNGASFYFFGNEAPGPAAVKKLQQAEHVAVWPQGPGDEAFASTIAESGLFKSVEHSEAGDVIRGSYLADYAGLYTADDYKTGLDMICRATDADVVFHTSPIGSKVKTTFLPSKRRVSLGVNLKAYSCADQSQITKVSGLLISTGDAAAVATSSQVQERAGRLWAARVLEAIRGVPQSESALTISAAHPFKNHEKLAKACGKSIEAIKADNLVMVGETAAKRAAWQQFIEGSYRLYTCQGLCWNMANANKLMQERSLYDADAWRGLARYLVFTKRLDAYDSRYFHLASAAEGLGYSEAAKTYYEAAQTISGISNEIRNCRFANQKFESIDTCMGQRSINRRSGSAIARIEKREQQIAEAERRADLEQQRAAQRERDRQAAAAAERKRKAREKVQREERRRARRASLEDRFPPSWVEMILRGEVDIGWSEEAVRESLGKPSSIQAIGTQEKFMEFARYQVVLIDGSVTMISEK